MTIRVGVAVMAHPKRRKLVSDLLQRLDRPAKVVWDQKGDRWHTGRRAQLAYQPGTSHHLVIQDDAIPCKDLVAGIEKALAHLPDPAHSPLCLYCGRVRPYREAINRLVSATAAGTSWLTMNQLHWGPGIVMPTHMIKDMVAWCDRRTNIPNYDRRISRWIQHEGLTVWYPWPSLVDHRSVKENPSLVPGRTGDRRAHRFLGADVSALTCRWDGRAVTIPALSGKEAPPSGQIGASVKFVSEKYPNLHIPTIGIRFRNGVAEATTRGAIAHLKSPWMRRRGVRPASEADAATAEQVAGNSSTKAKPGRAKAKATAAAPGAEAASVAAVEADPKPAQLQAPAQAPTDATPTDPAPKLPQGGELVPLGGGWWSVVVNGEQAAKVRGEQAARQRLHELVGQEA